MESSTSGIIWLLVQAHLNLDRFAHSLCSQVTGNGLTGHVTELDTSRLT